MIIASQSNQSHNMPIKKRARTHWDLTILSHILEQRNKFQRRRHGDLLILQLFNSRGNRGMFKLNYLFRTLCKCLSRHWKTRAICDKWIQISISSPVKNTNCFGVIIKSKSILKNMFFRRKSWKTWLRWTWSCRKLLPSCMTTAHKQEWTLLQDIISSQWIKAAVLLYVCQCSVLSVTKTKNNI